MTAGRTFARHPAADGRAEPGRRRSAEPATAENPIQHLQRTAGNRAVQRLLADAWHRDQPVEAAPRAVRTVLQAPGRPLDTAGWVAMAPRFAQRVGLDQVRIHTGEQAAHAAHAVAARAFTVGAHVVFGSGAYDPRGSAGQALLAHELAHVAEQLSTGRRAIARQPVEQYEEEPVRLTREVFESIAKRGYWWPLIADAYDVEPVPQRLFNPEEFDAVLSVLWRVRPKGSVQRETKQTVTIPPRAGAAGSKALIYEFTFRPRNPNDPNAKDSVRIEFVAEGATTTPVPAPQPGWSYRVPGNRSFSQSGFPIDAVQYWEAHPDEERQLWHWIERLAPTSFDQIVTTREAVRQKQVTTTREISYRVTGQKDKAGKVQNLRIEFLGTFRPAVEPVPADYRYKDFADLEIERLQARPNDKLGKVTIPASVPASERLPVKHAIHSYFLKGTRNAEVDLVLPIPGKANPVLYSLRFRSSNDVDVERVGERGPDTAAGQVDPDRLDIARSPEFAENARDPKTLRAWLEVRYPLLKPAGATTEELRENANKELGAKAGTPDWFKNYAITILDAKQGEKRLLTAHKGALVEGMKDYEARELRFLEGVLETATHAVLAKLRGLRMARQRSYIKVKEEPSEEVALRAGTTFTDGGDRTVVIYDRAFERPGLLFLGGTEGVLPEEAETIVHELGHVVGGTAIKKRFDEFVKKEGIKPFTHYAAKHPETEFFAEAFQLYQTDPEWMRTNLPRLFDWFQVLARTGKPPK
jgi:Domain of unknown function (DUF4157)